MPQKHEEENLSDAELSSEEIENIVEKVIELQLKTGGSTVNRFAESCSGQKYFAVAIFPERTFFVSNDDFSNAEAQNLLKKKVRLFIKTNSDLLKSGKCAIGSWLNIERNRIDFDISVLLKDKKRAVEIGEEYNQEAIFDLEKLQIIELSGTGEVPQNQSLLPDAERLRAVSE